MVGYPHLHPTIMKFYVIQVAPNIKCCIFSSDYLTSRKAVNNNLSLIFYVIVRIYVEI